MGRAQYTYALELAPAFGIELDRIRELEEELISMGEDAEVVKKLSELREAAESGERVESKKLDVIPWQQKATEHMLENIEQKTRDEFYEIIREKLLDLEDTRRRREDKHREYLLKEAQYIAKYHAYKDLERRYNGGEELKYDPHQMIVNACSDGFYKFAGLIDGFLFFTTAPVIMEHQREESGDLEEIDFGRFRVKLSTSSYQAEVLPFKNNILDENADREDYYYHPHVGTTGSICEGEASSTLQEARRNRDIETILNLTRAILLNYNDESPYASFESFATGEDERGRKDCDEAVHVLKHLSKVYGYGYEELISERRYESIEEHFYDTNPPDEEVDDEYDVEYDVEYDEYDEEEEHDEDL